MSRSFFTVLFCFSLLAACLPGENDNEETYAPGPEPVRGFWLTNVDSDAMFSPGGLRKAVDLCDRLGMNTIYAVTWNNATTMYPSGVMESLTGIAIDPRVDGWDPLDTLVRLAHEKGIRVIAWFEFGFASSYQDPSGGPILQKRPDWAARDRAGKMAAKNGFQWMNALHPEVQDLLISLILEVIGNYAVDGIQGDDRLPAMPSLAGYDELTVAAYRGDHNGAYPPGDFRDPAWVRWRADRLNAFMHRLFREVRAADPSVRISMAPSIYPWSLVEYLQDWPAWVDSGWVDEVIPQVYRYDIGKYQSALHEIVEHQVSEKNRSILFPGILLKVGDYMADTSFISRMILENRRHGVDGEVFFFYEGLVGRERYFTQRYRQHSIHH